MQLWQQVGLEVSWLCGPTQSSLFYVCVLTLTPEKLHKNVSKHVSALID